MAYGWLWIGSSCWQEKSNKRPLKSTCVLFSPQLMSTKKHFRSELSSVTHLKTISFKMWKIQLYTILYMRETYTTSIGLNNFYWILQFSQTGLNSSGYLFTSYNDLPVVTLLEGKNHQNKIFAWTTGGGVDSVGGMSPSRWVFDHYCGVFQCSFRYLELHRKKNQTKKLRERIYFSLFLMKT